MMPTFAPFADALPDGGLELELLFELEHAARASAAVSPTAARTSLRFAMRAQPFVRGAVPGRATLVNVVGANIS
jgi:hypothetical protein